jgi:hypothetical protein
MVTLEQPGRPTVWAAAFPRYRRLVVLRHPGLAALSPDEILAAAERLRETEFYRAYARWERLVDASTIPGPWKPSARSLLRLLDRRKIYDPGVFCSELVAKFYAEVGLPLFDHELSSGEVSPGRLASADCRLIPLNTPAVISAADLAVGATASEWSACRKGRWDRRLTLRHLVRERDTVRRISADVDAFNVGLQCSSIAHWEAVRFAAEVQVNRITSQTAGDDSHHPTVVRNSGARLHARALALQELMLAIGADDRTDLSPFPLETLALQNFAGGLAARLSYQSNRRTILAAMGRLRAAPAPGTRRARTKLARIWAQHRKYRHEMAEMHRRLQTPVSLLDVLERVCPTTRDAVLALFRGLEDEPGVPWGAAWNMSIPRRDPRANDEIQSSR